MPRVLIPKKLTTFTNGISRLTLNFNQLNGLGTCLQKEYPALYSALYNDAQQLKNFVCIYLNETLVRDISKNIAPISEHDVIEILIAISGG